MDYYSSLQGICQLTVFTSYACGFLSVWFVAVITCENYIRIAHSDRVSSCCTIRRAVIVIGVMTFISVALNSVNLWITRVVTTDDPEGHSTIQGECKSLSAHEQLHLIMTYTDTVLTLLVPLLCILLVVLAIAHHVVLAQRRRKRLRAGTQRAHGIKRQQTPQVKMSRFLLAISLIFLVLNTPSHAIRIKMAICLYVFGQKPTLTEHAFHRVFELLFYLNFCNNCLIFILFGDNFRSTFRSLFKFHFFRPNQKDVNQVEKDRLVQSDITELVPV